MKDGFSTELLRAFFRRSFWITLILSVSLAISVPALTYYFDKTHYTRDSVDMLNHFIDAELGFDLADMLENPGRYDDLKRKIDNFMQFGSMVDFKIWLADGTNLYAYDNPSMAGLKFPDNDDLFEAINEGEAHASIESGGESENLALAGYGELLEIYVPIVSSGGKIAGAVEVYRVPPQYRLLGPHVYYVAGVGIGTFMMLYLLLFGNFKRAAARIIEYDRKLGDTIQMLEHSYADTIESLLKALEIRDMETEGHAKRVVSMCDMLATELNLDPRERQRLLLGAYLHDIGKIGISDTILLKAGRLDEAERQRMKQHVQMGYDLIKDIEFLSPARDVVLYHHEKWDGSGYLEGLKGSDIPLPARIFALVDVFDALLSRRPYKEPVPFEEARKIILEDRGRHFDPHLVDMFIALDERKVHDALGRGAGTSPADIFFRTLPDN